MSRSASAHAIELLAPAGGPDAFAAALAGGADAIYCGLGSSLNARRSAQNFDDEGFEEACRLAHLAGVRVYVTINVVIPTCEMNMALNLVRRAWLLGADAFIVQDWGLLAEIHTRWPEIELHISTQANVHDPRGVAWAAARGADRVTLSRELSLKEMASIAEQGIELECFGHGAICFCYSGICMMSSLRGGRSANRGACAQPCRLPYELIDEDGMVIEAPGVETAHIPETSRGVGGVRTLCPKDMCTVDNVRDLIAAGVGSLKIEGRMKSADYVLSVVRAYRSAVDEAAAEFADEKNNEQVIDGAPELSVDERHRLLRRSFNRDFTNEYLWGRSGNKLMSYERSNNRGELVGRVVGARTLEDTVVRRGGGNGGRARLRRVGRADVTLQLNEPVGKGDLLELRPLDDPSQFLTVLAPSAARAGDELTVRTPRAVPAGSLVRVIRSQEAMDAADRVASRDYPRKRGVRVDVVVQQNQPLTITIATLDGEAQARATGPVVAAARTRELTVDEVVEHVGRMGTSPFEAREWKVELEPGCGMGFSTIHAVRARACELLEEQLLAPYAARAYHTAGAPEETAPCQVEDQSAAAAVDHENPDAAEICALVTSPECARAAREAGATRIYALADDLCAEDTTWPEDVIPWLDEVCREVDYPRVNPFIAAGRSVAVGNVSELAGAVDAGALPEIRSCIPVHNTSSLMALTEAGAAGLWFSPELTLAEMCELAREATIPVGLSVFGHERTMTTEHCVLQVAGECTHRCDTCRLRAKRLSLRDVDGNLLPVRTDRNARSRIFAAYPFDATPHVGEMLQAGITRFLVDGQLMDEQAVTMAVRRVASALMAVREGRRPAPRAKGAVSGHLFNGID